MDSLDIEYSSPVWILAMRSWHLRLVVDLKTLHSIQLGFGNCSVIDNIYSIDLVDPYHSTRDA